MDNLGRTLDNTHQGNTRIEKGLTDEGDLTVQGDLIVEGDVALNNLIVNDLEVVNELKVDGYSLPTSKGNAGDIIVATGEGSTSQWQPAFDANSRIWQNIYSMTEAAPTLKGVILRIDEEGIGIKTIPIEQFPVNSCMKLHAKGQFILDGDQEAIKSFKIYHDFKINNTNQLFTFIWGGNATGNPIVFGPITQGHWEVELYYTRINETEIQLTSTCFNSYNVIPGVVQSPIGASIYNIEGLPIPIPPQPIIITIPPSAQTLTFNISAIDTSPELTETCQLKTEIYTIDLCNSEGKIIATSANLTTDHNLLSNLTLGDAGHSQFALLQGREGGQILSGGITPLHDLKLKSHSIGLDNVIIRDLKTEFKKDVDMDNNNINNANLISNTDGSIQYNTPSYGLEITTQNSKSLNIVSALDAKLTATNSLDIAAGSLINFYNGLATQMTIDSSEIGANIPLNMNSNNIINAKDIVDPSTSNKIDMNSGGFLNSLELSSADEIKLLNTTSNNFVNVSNGGLNIASSVGSLNISHATQENTIDLNDGSLLGGLSIKSNNIGVLIQENSSGNNVGITSGSGGLVVNSGQLNIRNTDGANNLTIAKQNGGDINLDVQTGGGVVKINNSNLDMNFNGIINCAFIDGLKPSGGLYSESSGFIITSATLTETNLLGQGASSGTLAVPANGFSALDAYSFKCSGVLSGGTNDEFTLKLKSLVDGINPVEFGSINVILADNGLVDVPWSVSADFTVRSLGVAGVAVLVLSGNFSYSNNNEVVRIYLRTIIDNTNFDTTLSNQLLFTFQNDATNPLINFRIDQASFTKWY